MLIYIIRHAYAHERGDPRWPDDSQRPLEAKGAKRFHRAMKALAKSGFKPAMIATSPYVRCRETAEIVAEEVGGKPEVVELDALEPGSDLDELVAWSQKQEADAIAWVGHSPDVENLAAALLADANANIRFAKGAVAAIRFDGELVPGNGELQWLVTAKVLGA
jgi:phosphohistidine phosphatase